MPLISDARVEAEILRSMTCVAPIDLRYSACLREAVVMMGENPESFASWIAERLMLLVNYFSTICYLNLPFWPTELDPPITRKGFPAYFPLPSGDTGGTNPCPCGTLLYIPTYGEVRAMGKVAA